MNDPEKEDLQFLQVILSLIWALIVMQNSDPPRFCHHNYLCQHLTLYILLIQSFNIILCIFMFYQQHLSRLLRSKRQCGRHKETVYRSFHVHGAVICTTALATGTNHAVFSTSKVYAKMRCL